MHKHFLLFQCAAAGLVVNDLDDRTKYHVTVEYDAQPIIDLNTAVLCKVLGTSRERSLSLDISYPEREGHIPAAPLIFLRVGAIASPPETLSAHSDNHLLFNGKPTVPVLEDCSD